MRIYEGMKYNECHCISACVTISRNRNATESKSENGKYKGCNCDQ